MVVGIVMASDFPAKCFSFTAWLGICIVIKPQMPVEYSHTLQTSFYEFLNDLFK